VGLIVLLAHVGSFVPADAARVPLVDRIFTRLASPESFSRRVAQSAFMCELQQVASLLRHHTRRSLLLIDEFGKGTLAADGLALLCSVLRFIAAGAAPPLALVSTHYRFVLVRRRHSVALSGSPCLLSVCLRSRLSKSSWTRSRKTALEQRASAAAAAAAACLRSRLFTTVR
jgi:DNA mismatch repair protein MSH5